MSLFKHFFLRAYIKLIKPGRDRVKANYISILNGKDIATNRIVYEEYPKIYGRIIISNKGEIRVGKNLIINSSFWSNPVGNNNTSQLCVLQNAKLTIGNNVGISNSLLYVAEEMNIEDDVMIGGGCQIFDTDFHSLVYSDRIKGGDYNAKTKSVLIKRGAFIGCNSIVLKGTTIGEKSIIGAGSIVRGNIPDGEIWSGNPAIFIKKIEND